MPEGGTARLLPPWEDSRTPFPRNLLDTWVGSVLRPQEFFRSVPWDAAAARPILYYLITSVIAAVFSLWWTAIWQAVEFPLGFTGSDAWGLMPSANDAMFSFFAAPFFSFLALILWSGLLHVLTVLFARQRRGYRATIRTVCYASGPQVFNIVPFFGGLIGLVWSLVLVTIGLRHAHRMTSGPAFAVVAIAVAIPLALGVALLLTLVAALAAIA